MWSFSKSPYLLINRRHETSFARREECLVDASRMRALREGFNDISAQLAQFSALRQQVAAKSVESQDPDKVPLKISLSTS